MIQCPDCRQMIPDDSAFCDQCGKELRWCPECRRPKRGTECPVCGSYLVDGRKWLSSAPDPVSAPAPASAAEEPSRGESGPLPLQPGTTKASGEDCAAGENALVGNGWTLALKEGPFGRIGGIWPELSTCPYVSGNHGRIEKDASGWILVDVGSKNGTYVNGVRIQREILRKGARVRIATLEFTVE